MEHASQGLLQRPCFFLYLLKARETHGTDATLTDSEDAIHTIRDSVDFARQNLAGDVSLGSAVKDNYLFGKAETEVQPNLLPTETKDFLNTNKQRENVGRVNSEDSVYM